MDPWLLGTRYDAIAQNWQQQMQNSDYGLGALKKALSYAAHYHNTLQAKALDIGCGAGGRMIHGLVAAGYMVKGIDVSAAMLALAAEIHQDAIFELADICSWQTTEIFDFILAWDSIFHVPYHSQQAVLESVCKMLKPGGVMLYTFGDDSGEHQSLWHDMYFYYSSLGIQKNIEILHSNGCTCLYMEADQFPLPHMVCIVRKEENSKSYSL
jgi:trans-aconitate methyltransferase